MVCVDFKPMINKPTVCRNCNSSKLSHPKKLNELEHLSKGKVCRDFKPIPSRVTVCLNCGFAKSDHSIPGDDAVFRTNSNKKPVVAPNYMFERRDKDDRKTGFVGEKPEPLAARCETYKPRINTHDLVYKGVGADEEISPPKPRKASTTASAPPPAPAPEPADDEMPPPPPPGMDDSGAPDDDDMPPPPPPPE